MLPDIVIPCRPGANEELRYALRSLKNLPHRNVWIIGGLPDWVRGVRWFEYPRSTTKYETVSGHIYRACKHPEVSDPFILMNDDFYIMKPVQAPPAWHRGTIREAIKEFEAKGIQSTYLKGMRDTLRTLESAGYEDPKSYELHVPMLMRKDHRLAAANMGIGHDVFHYRSAYGAIAELKTRKHGDVKIYQRNQKIPTGAFLSSSDDTFEYLRPILEAAFPDPSPYEA